MAAAAPVIAAVIGAAVSLKTSEDQKGLAYQAERNRKDAQDKLSLEQTKKEQEMKIQEQRDTELSKKKTKAAVSGGRSDTILTSPLGVIEGEKSVSKTLLGA